MKKFRVTFKPGGKEAVVKEGKTLREAFALAGVPLEFSCGGKGRCGKCRVRLEAKGAPLPPPAPAEKEHLEEEELAGGIRLACMVEVRSDLAVFLPEVRQETQILMEAASRVVALAPPVSKTFLEVPPPSLADQRPDWERLRDALGAAPPPPLDVLRELPVLLRSSGYRLTAVTSGAEVLGLEAGDTTGKLLGAAFDIGTTTIVCYLLDLRSGEELGVASMLNPQAAYGADVISRIAYTSEEPEGLEKLHQCLIAGLNELLAEASIRAGASPQDVYVLSVVGNTCMHHLFLKIPPGQLARSPYVPVVKEPLVLRAAELGLRANPRARLYVLPIIAGFVGADTVGVILATQMDLGGGVKLAVDIGTNGEIVLGTGEGLIACSAAAGPAFEGAQISCGMRGAAGAIDHVWFGEDLEYSVIGGGKPRGICGSGLLDLAAGLLTLGIIDKSGRMLPPFEVESPIARRYRNRIVEYDGMTSFLLVDETSTSHGRPLLLTQRDVRQLQLAKAAIAAGIQVLLEERRLKPEDVDEVLLAGAFGNYFDPRSACAIGLLPPQLLEKVRQIGNAAGAGAKIALLSRHECRRAGAIARAVEYVELSAYPGFNNIFTASLEFPELRSSTARGVKINEI